MFNKEEERKEVWLRAWTMVAQSSSCMRPGVATEWADKCLKEFDSRFGNNE